LLGASEVPAGALAVVVSPDLLRDNQDGKKSVNLDEKKSLGK